MSVRLLKLEPVGIGTPQIESLPSFLIRLSSEHGSTAREVVAVTACNVSAPVEAQVQVLNRGLSVLVRPDDQSGAILLQLQLGLPGCASVLPRTTFQCLKGAFDKAGSAISNTFKWCPRCFRQDEALRQPTYLRLLWHFSALECCPIHKIPMYSVCPSCGKRQDRRCRREELHVCVWCQGRLTAESREMRPRSSWENEDQDLVDLVSAISIGEFTMAVEGSARQSIDRMFDEAWRTGHEAEFWQLVPRDECLAVVECRKPITLEMARRYSKVFGLSLADLFMGRTPRTAQLPAFAAAKDQTMRRRGMR